jgi:S1-C subfamily serine protease
MKCRAVGAGLLAGLLAAGAAAAGTVKLRPGQAPPPGACYTDPLPDFGMGMDGRFVEGGIEITKVYRNGATERAGLEPGDVLVSVNGQTLREPADWIQGMTNQNGRLSFRLRDVRTGQIVSREVHMR